MKQASEGEKLTPESEAKMLLSGSELQKFTVPARQAGCTQKGETRATMPDTMCSRSSVDARSLAPSYGATFHTTPWFWLPPIDAVPYTLPAASTATCP